MGDVNTGSSSSQSSSPAVRKAVDTLASGVTAAYSPGKSLYQAPSANTTQGWQASLNAANNPAYAGGMSGAISSYANRAAGNELGVNDPLYAAQRSRLIDDTKSAVGSVFTGSGRFGGGSYVNNLTDQLSSNLNAADLSQRSESYSRQAEAANILPTLFQGAQLPAGIQQSVGAAQDAEAAAKAAGPTDYLAKLTAIAGGNAAAAGTTTNQSTPLWKLLLGGAATVAGAQ
ncbi:MAG: hypothetical protein EOO12_00205 [Chitinophagaceae bacterium]|nr:MAG: hypothetical protein EOO12_00205 [Chitinophagaceae bacterium]